MKACLGALLLTLGAWDASAATKAFDLQTLAEGVHAMVWKEPLTDPIEGNVLIIINEQDVLIVDSPFLPSTARRIVAEVRKLTPKPVKYVVNTHWHNDHVQGNDVYREAWPGVQFISHTETRQDAIDYAFGQIPKGRESAAQAITTMRGWLETGQDTAGKEIDPDRRLRITNYITFLEGMVEETASIETVASDITFDEQLTLFRGSRRIDLVHLGLGNTRGDIVVLLPKERIVATGDLVVHPEPFGFGSYYKEWIETLGRLAALEVDTFLPGHGPVMRDRSYIETLQALLRTLTTEVDAAVAEGLSLDETKKVVTLDEWKKKLAGDDAAVRRAFEQFFIAPAVERAWKQATKASDGFGQGS